MKTIACLALLAAVVAADGTPAPANPSLAPAASPSAAPAPGVTKANDNAAAAANTAGNGTSTTSNGPTCDISGIKGKLYPNATDGFASCKNASGFDVWDFTKFPTADQAKDIMHSPDCANYINQVQQVANKASQCTVQINGTSRTLDSLFAGYLNGKTGNETDSSSSSSGSGSMASKSKNKTKKGTSSSGSGTTLVPTKTSTPSKTNATTPAPSPKSSAPTLASTLAIGAVAIIGFVLQF